MYNNLAFNHTNYITCRNTKKMKVKRKGTLQRVGVKQGKRAGRGRNIVQTQVRFWDYNIHYLVYALRVDQQK